MIELYPRGAISVDWERIMHLLQPGEKIISENPGAKAESVATLVGRGLTQNIRQDGRFGLHTITV